MPSHSPHPSTALVADSSFGPTTQRAERRLRPEAMENSTEQAAGATVSGCRRRGSVRDGMAGAGDGDLAQAMSLGAGQADAPRTAFSSHRAARTV
ncbi:hypothetical protein [Streptomyces buecherae]|uniref:hypothetical protein n=1 Tax=Streptomyces buecherae TaxID=2763006 RepID=UPI003698892A